MTGVGLIFLLLNSLALLIVPRRLALVPLLIVACYMTMGQRFVVGPFNFYVIRVLFLVGAIRILVRGERLPGGLIKVDKLMLVWAAWVSCSGFFHVAPFEAVVYRLGIAYNYLGIYFLTRVFCRDFEDVAFLAATIAALLLPLAFEMVQEQLTGHNLFAVLGGVNEWAIIRADRIRAQGPFSHAILAGTVGAGCIPLAIGIWRTRKVLAAAGLGACMTIIVACMSSGPLMSAAFGIFALALWRWKHLTRQMRGCAILCYIVLDMVMTRPAYFIISKFDLTGSSTGWHRAQLIRSSIQHIGEWWLAGTDYTRHWMETGVPFSENHTDITSHYLFNGVLSGLPAVLLFLGILWTAFVYVGSIVKQYAVDGNQDAQLAWALGASLFSYAMSAISVAYFDQSYVFLYVTVAAIGSLKTVTSICPIAPVVSDSPSTLNLECPAPAGTISSV